VKQPDQRAPRPLPAPLILAVVLVACVASVAIAVVSRYDERPRFLALEVLPLSLLAAVFLWRHSAPSQARAPQSVAGVIAAGATDAPAVAPSPHGATDSPVPVPVLPPAGQLGAAIIRRKADPGPGAKFGGAPLPARVFERKPSADRAPWLLPSAGAPPGIAVDAATVGDLAVRAASLVGSGHRCAEPVGPRQDAYSLGRGPEHLVIAVADGVSAARHSEYGAAGAAAGAVDEVQAALRTGLDPARLGGETVFAAVARRMDEMAQVWNLHANDLLTALMVVVIPTRPAPSASREIWVGWIGDCAAWLRTGPEDGPAGWRPLAGDPKSNGPDRNVLRAVLPRDPGLARSAVRRLAPGAVLTIATDGLGDAFADVPGLAAVFAQAWSQPPSAVEYLRDMSFSAPGQLDDRTAVTVWCGPGDRPRPGRREN
jgi:hypothetical protein